MARLTVPALALASLSWLLPFLPARPARGVVPAETTPRHAPRQEGGILGFEVGEERRYALEGDRVEPAEFAAWRLVLESKEGDGPDTVGVFVLEHEAAFFARRSNALDPDEILRADVRVTVRVNRDGFPLRIDYRRLHDRSLIAREGREIHAEYEADDDRYRVERPHAMGFRVRHAYVPEHDTYDRTVPRGAFLDPGLNPGLLALAFAALEAAGDQEVEFLGIDPTRMGRPLRGGGPRRELGALGRGWSGGAPPSGSIGFDRVRLQLEERTTVEVGPETFEAFRYRRAGSARDLFVSLDGVPLKQEVRHDWSTAWIRLLHPFEY